MGQGLTLAQSISAAGGGASLEVNLQQDAAGQVTEVLAQIQRMATACQYVAPEGLPLDQVGVQVVDGSGSARNLPKVESAAACGGSADGWFNDLGGVQLCARTCADVTADALSSVNYLTGCAAP